jgi:nitroreductase
MSGISTTRRGLLWTGGAMTLGVSGGLVFAAQGCTPDSSSDPAYAPWQLWNDPALRGTPLALVAAAILAANPHDSQPWLFHVTPDRIEIVADTSRNLGAMDPFLREMHIGLGCALENVAVVAPANGYAAAIALEPGSLVGLGERRAPVRAATIALTKLSGPQPGSKLDAAIALRHTNRFPYDPARPLPQAWRDAVAAFSDEPDVRVFLFETRDGRTRYDAAIIDATQAIISDAPMIADSDRWIRMSHADIEKYRSGPTLDAAGLSPLTLLLAKWIPLPAAANHAAWLSQTREQVSSAPIAGIVAVRDRYDRPSALAAGRAWQRLHLTATSLGVAMQPLNQPAEMVDRERQTGKPPQWRERLASLTGNKEWEPTFFFRAGVPTSEAPPSPRRALRDVVG